MPGTELFAALVESADDAIVTTTLDGRILTWNRGAERLYGYTAADVVGHPITFLVPDDLHDEIGEMLATHRPTHSGRALRVGARAQDRPPHRRVDQRVADPRRATASSRSRRSPATSPAASTSSA